MAYEKLRIINASGRTIRVEHPELPGAPNTALTATVSATGTSLTVADNTGLAQNDFILIGKPGSERSEAVRVSAAVTRGTALTVTAVVFDHPKDAAITKVPFDQVRIYGNSTDDTGTATLIDTVDIKWDEPFTTYINTGTEYAYYYAIGYDSNAASEFTFSDGIPVVWAENTFGKAIDMAFQNAKMERGVVSVDWLFRQAENCLRKITGKLRHWSFLQVFDYSLGAVVRGTYSLSAPSDIEDPNSPKSVLGFRIGASEDLIYKDKGEFESLQEDVVRTQVRTEASANDTTLEIDNSYDFADSGSVDVFVSGTKYTITYTGVTRSTTAGVLTGIPSSGTGSISVTIPVDTDVWQNVEEGSPTYWSVWNGNFYFWPLADSSHDYTNALLDYYSKKTTVDQYSDAIDGPRYDAVEHYLTAALRSRNNEDGKMDLDDPDYLMYLQCVADMVVNEDSGQKHKFKYRNSFKL